MPSKKIIKASLSDIRDDVDDRDPVRPIWWRGPIKTTGCLPPRELREMANADCRFLDEEEVA